MNLKRLPLYSICFLLMVACAERKVEFGDAAVASTTAPSKPVDVAEVSMISLGQDVFAAGDLSEHLFGRFYNDRVSFYIMENVPITLGNNDYQGTMILYFIDEILYKKRFIVDALVLEDFLKEYGGAGEVVRNNEKELEGIDEKRFFTVKINRNNVEYKLRKNDYDNYSIEEYHPMFRSALIAAKS